jgi:adenine-specific DNA-methyltransferase
MSDTPSLQKRLCQTYQLEEWRKILHGIFPDGTVKLFSTPQPLSASQEFVKSTLQLGTIDLLDGNTIALLEVETSNQVKLARNRVGLRNFVASYIDEAGASAVLAVFHQAKSDDWRLTYAARQSTLDEDTFEITTIETAPRRFTFLLGKNEPCRTAASRLASLLEKGGDLSLTHVEKAFSIETLSKDFFKKYKIHYQAFVDHLLSPSLAGETREVFGIPVLADTKEQDKADKPIRDFVKTLLGRLVFLHFLQKKGWLGCKAGGKSWVGGDPDFLQSFYTLAKSKHDAALFHSKYLCPLFHEALNQSERSGDLFPLTNSRLPYLNGGLFEEDSGALRSLDFPPELFGNLLDFFGEYNFTIDENDPEDHEVGIDPEMLGHIFENLLEDNKDKGAFYTPKAIVSYMSRQSLLHYLQTHLGENKELETLLNEKDYTKHEGKDSFVAANREKIAKLLDDVKICDPAIGSGAFPIGLLQEILWTRLALQPELNTPPERAKLKRQIIQHSIHGVDIDPGAIEIARLRFWLALVVDEDEPRPLPNLDYKIHRADSLIEYIRGEPVNLGTEPPKDHASRDAVAKLVAAKQSLFAAQGLKEKRNAWLDLYRALAQLAQAEFTWMRTAEGLFGADAARAALLDRGIRDFRDRIREIDEAKKQKVHVQETVLSKLKHWFDDSSKPTFLWNLHFGEIFANGGFDLVIANPPYFDVKGMDVKMGGLIFSRYKCAANRINLYSTFIELAFEELVNDSGSMAFIIPNSLLQNSSYSKLRKLLLPNVRQIVKLPDNVFEEPTVETILLFTSSSEIQEAEILSFGNDDKFVIPKNLPKLAKSLWLDQKDVQFQLTLCNADFDLLSKIEGEHLKLDQMVETCLGITPYDKSKGHTPDQIKKRSFHSAKQESDEYVPLIDGSRIFRFYIKNEAVEYLRYGPWLGRPRERRFYTSPRIVVRQILKNSSPRLVCAYCNESAFHTQIAFTILPTVAPEKLEFECHFLVAILSSSVVDFYHEKRFLDPEKVVFPKALIANFREIPIPAASVADKARLAELAEACAAAAKKNDTASLLALEEKINRIVYRLFDLTADEIALIESSLAG